MTRDEALEILTEFTKNTNLLKHAFAVEAAMRTYAERFGEDKEQWGIVGLLHDFDYEQHPTAEEHPVKGAAILRDRGVPEEIVCGILAHAPHTGEPRDTPIKRTIFAVDELAGFIIAVALVRPNKLLAEVTVESVLKKLKTASFAANVNRDDIALGAKELGIPLAEHVQVVLMALQGLHNILGL